MAQGNEKEMGFFSPQQQNLFGGMARGISSAFSPGQKQIGRNIGNFMTTPLIPTAAPAPSQVAKPPAMPAPTAQPTVQPPTNTVDFGGGSSLTAHHPLAPASIAGMQRAVMPSTPEALALRADSAAMADQRYADLHARDVAPQGMGMQRLVEQAQGPDYSGVIDQAIGTMNSSRPTGSFDRQVEWKHKVANAANVLNQVGGLQNAANQNATSQNIAGMNNVTDQQRIAAAQDEARQRTALGMGQLASEDQYRQGQVQASQMGAQVDAQKYADEQALKQRALQKEVADQEARTNFLRNQYKGMFGGVSPEEEAMAQAGGSGAVPLDYILKKQK